MNEVSSAVTPERILQSVWAFAPALAIEAAIRHRVFDLLAARPLSLVELQGATGASARGLSAIANLLVGLDLLRRNDVGRYALTAESEAFLVSGRPGFVGGIFRHMKELDNGVWLISFTNYDLAFIDLEQKTLQPLDSPFGPRVSPMS